MGYTTTLYRARDDKEAALYALQEICFSKDGESNRILAFSTDKDVIGHGYSFVTYAALELIRNDQERRVIAMTVLQHRTATEIGWKFVDETMGPNNNHCPIAILDLLTPTENHYANHFRKLSRMSGEAQLEQPQIITLGQVA